jgi:uncharacterized protein YgfB (UPF0149 family)
VTALYSLDYDTLSRSMAVLAVSPAELHGSLCGYLCAGGAHAARQWLTQLCIDDDGLPASAHAELESLRTETIVLLGDPDLRFQPFLPPDDLDMATRVQTLADWATGFLGGFGLTGVGEREGLSDDAGDALRDLERIAHFGYEPGEDAEDETAFSEILEYVRVAVLLLHQEAASTGAPADATRH